MTRRPRWVENTLRGLLLSVSALFVVGQGSPSHTISNFRDLPARLGYFDDTDTAIYHDPQEGNMYISLDEGKSWKLADGIPSGKATAFIEHPVNNQYGFVLTDGTTHYRTEDHGRTWRSFQVPVEPALVSRPLSFHSDPKKYDHILYQGMSCTRQGWSNRCHDETYYTTQAFSDDPKLLRKDTKTCVFAHSSKDFKHEAHENLIYCTGFDASSSTERHDLSNSRLFSSIDFFQSERVEDLGIGRNAKGIIAFAVVSKFGVVALKDLSVPNGDLHLYVTVDTKTWARGHFPHASSARLRENAYTMLESSTHSLAVDVVLKDNSPIGTLFVSNSNGTYFVESLKDTNRNDFGFVDYEKLYGIEGIGMANVVANAQDVESRGRHKKLKTYITYDDGSNWVTIRPPTKDAEGKQTSCDPSDEEKCSLHFHSVTTPHNYGRIFSSPAPGFVMGVGSIGESLDKYDDSDTFLSTDAGLTWTMVAKGAHKYEFGDQGSILVAVDDEDWTDEVKYSLDLGKTWKTYNFGEKIRARGLTTLPDSTSQKFLLLGYLRRTQKDGSRAALVWLDFSKTRGNKCGPSDFERWYAQRPGSGCLMGHKQWYNRRKTDANCYVGEKFKDPVEHESNCSCTDQDFECDYNFVRNGDHCEPIGPEPIPAGTCKSNDDTYLGSSGWRKIPGNTCEGGSDKDNKIKKPCSAAQPAEGAIIHQQFDFHSPITQNAYFNESRTVLVRLSDGTVYQSSNEGYSWLEPVPGTKFIAFYHHKFTEDRAYLITSTKKFYYTTDTGRSWHEANAPAPPSGLTGPVLHFHPISDYLIWSGSFDCENQGGNCRAEAHVSRDNGRRWDLVERYVRNCAFAKDSNINADPNEIVCESYKEKSGNQRFFSQQNPLELVVGGNFFRKKTKIFDHVVGFAKFSEYFVVAEMVPDKHTLELQVSLDGVHFASGQFPPSMRPEMGTHAYTILESSTDSLFLHMTMSEAPAPFWGTILKSNSNGTYFGISLDNVNRNDAGYVDFEKMIGLDGIALINVVSNTDQAVHSGHKELQSRITHNDGSTWTPLNPPPHDSQGNKYECSSTKCQLNIHGYTERRDSRATYSTPSVKGLLMAVGNVGETLAPYTESDTFLSRDAGFTWEEVHKDAHLWEFGDSGSILIMANDEEPTNHVLFSTDEGLNWREYQFSEHPFRVYAIVTVPMDTSRRFILFGGFPGQSGSAAIHIDFSSLTSRKCAIDFENPGKDDFELWSPSENRPEQCLFGRQTLYHRRVRDANCIVGDQKKAADRIVENCPCTKADFECEFNHVKNANDDCVLVPGTTPLEDDGTCRGDDEYWYERTPYRKIPFSTCVEGYRPDRGKEHQCPGFRSKGAFFWLFMLILPFGFTALVAYYYYRKSGLARGTIRLPGDRGGTFGEGGVMDTLASIPWFILGLGGIAFEWLSSQLEPLFRSRSGYRDVPIDEDAQILRFEDEE
ncbi:Oligoxyloglucan reducing end-specific cellobiohydrolase [Crepidotus variabilis]|uniref:Oligoxyloglucan reducing end-specific cellobiohydrolase n=1 Tax=Crepidotus variabilis TaxID=179855 RepID=A0A9P6E8G7_9AGAR|nr:Oligoxyloglucan reducing end-specific cellobiohydrolase [Crepidotus variabilis]